MRAPPPGTEPLVAGCCRSDMARFKPVFIRSQFTHVYAVVCREVHICYRPVAMFDTVKTSPTGLLRSLLSCNRAQDSLYYLTVYTEKSVPLFGPSIPSHGFSDPLAFR